MFLEQIDFYSNYIFLFLCVIQSLAEWFPQLCHWPLNKTRISSEIIQPLVTFCHTFSLVLGHQYLIRPNDLMDIKMDFFAAHPDIVPMHVGPYIVPVQTMCITFILSLLPSTSCPYPLHCGGPLKQQGFFCASVTKCISFVMCSPSVLKTRGDPNMRARVSTLSGTRLSSIKTSSWSKYVVLRKCSC